MPCDRATRGYRAATDRGSTVVVRPRPMSASSCARPSTPCSPMSRSTRSWTSAGATARSASRTRPAPASGWPAGSAATYGSTAGRTGARRPARSRARRPPRRRGVRAGPSRAVAHGSAVPRRVRSAPPRVWTAPGGVRRARALGCGSPGIRIAAFSFPMAAGPVVPPRLALTARWCRRGTNGPRRNGERRASPQHRALRRHPATQRAARARTRPRPDTGRHRGGGNQPAGPRCRPPA